jgi:PBSX family phage terminase large subunit
MLDQLVGGLGEKQGRSIREATQRVNLWEGSIRSGKTIASLIRWLLFVAIAPRGGELVIIGRTRDSAWRNIVAPLQDPSITGPAARHIVGNHGAPTVSILGRRVFIMGASDAKAEKVLRGLTVAGAYVDEVTTIPEEFFTQLLGRMSVPGARLFGTTNPDNPAHWLKRKYLDRITDLPGWRSWHFTIDDNPGLTEQYKASIRAEFTGLWYRRFILGEWVAAEGAIYSMWDPTAHVIPWASLPPMQRLLAVGVDYGTTNATAGLLLGLSDERNHRGQPESRLYLVDEWRHDPALTNVRLTDAQLSAGLRDWMGGAHMPPGANQPRIEWTVVDPAAASFKVQLHADGLTNVSDADNDVAYGIRTVASLLGSGQMLVSDRCQGFIREAPGYAWDDKATAKGEDKPVKVADHSLDAGRYAVTTTETLWRGHLTDTLPSAA